MDIFSLIALEIREGQQLDMEFEHRKDVKAESIWKHLSENFGIVGCKLGRLALFWEASSEEVEQLYDLA